MATMMADSAAPKTRGAKREGIFMTCSRG
jgi:hypothetical protein